MLHDQGAWAHLEAPDFVYAGSLCEPDFLQCCSAAFDAPSARVGGLGGSCYHYYYCHHHHHYTALSCVNTKQHCRHVGSSYEASKSTCRDCKLELRILDLLFRGGGGRAGVMMTTLLCRHPEQYLQKSRFTQYLQNFRDVGPSSYTVTKLTSGRCELDLGIVEGVRRKLEIGWGEAISELITTPFRGHPEEHFHTLAHTGHTPLQKQALLRRGLGFRGVGESLPRTAGIFVLMFIRCRASVFRSSYFKTFLAALALCTVFTPFSYCPTTCGLAFLPRRVCNASCCRSFAACAPATSLAVTVEESEPLQLLQLSHIGSLRVKGPGGW